MKGLQLHWKNDEFEFFWHSPDSFKKAGALRKKGTKQSACLRGWTQLVGLRRCAAPRTPQKNQQGLSKPFLAETLT